MEQFGSRKGFIVDCLRRGVPLEKIQEFLRELGVDRKTSKIWIETAQRELDVGVRSGRAAGPHSAFFVPSASLVPSTRRIRLPRRLVATPVARILHDGQIIHNNSNW